MMKKYVDLNQELKNSRNERESRNPAVRSQESR